MLVFGLRLIRYSLLPETFSESKIHPNAFAAGVSLQSPDHTVRAYEAPPHFLSSRLGKPHIRASSTRHCTGQKYTSAPVFFWPPYLLYSLIIIWIAFC